jgi:hypothetical protein
MVLVVDIACFLVIFRATSNNVMVAGQAILQSTVYRSVLVACIQRLRSENAYGARPLLVVP